ncbi:MAG: GFA family protein [Deltaproteobacteria bacterium]|nr:GFA family protein [Deltaproteobacteria bacterium]
MGPPSRPSAFAVVLQDDGALTQWIASVRDPLLSAAGAAPDRWGTPLPHVTVARLGRSATDEDVARARIWAEATPVPNRGLRLDKLALYTWADRSGDSLFRIVDAREVGEPTRYEGGCHCGAVRFAVTVRDRTALDCNCSICQKKGILHVIVDDADFDLLAGEQALCTYTFGTHTAKHQFCSVCGMHPFYRPRSHPDSWDVNARCLDGDALREFTVTPFDGRNWEDNVESIR